MPQHLPLIRRYMEGHSDLNLHRSELSMPGSLTLKSKTMTHLPPLFPEHPAPKSHHRLVCPAHEK